MKLPEQEIDIDYETQFRKRGDPAFQAVVCELLEQLIEALGGRRA